MVHISTQIDITAPAARVWEILADFTSYPEWNPFLRSIRGAQQPGSTLEITIQLTSGKAISSKTKLLVFDPASELRWQGRLLVPGLLDGEHYFRISEQGSGLVRVVHGAQFSGLLASLVFRDSLQRQNRETFEAMDQALKRRAEAK